jgi:uncharacterized protein
MHRDAVLLALKEHDDELVSTFAVASLRLFGSVARDEDLAGSDVDLLVSFRGEISFRRFMQLKFRLEEILGMRVDLITETGLKPAVRPYVERDAIRVA